MSNIKKVKNRSFFTFILLMSLAFHYTQAHPYIQKITSPYLHKNSTINPYAANLFKRVIFKTTPRVIVENMKYTGRQYFSSESENDNYITLYRGHSYDPIIQSKLTQTVGIETSLQILIDIQNIGRTEHFMKRHSECNDIPYRVGFSGYKYFNESSGTHIYEKEIVYTYIDHLSPYISFTSCLNLAKSNADGILTTVRVPRSMAIKNTFSHYSHEQEYFIPIYVHKKYIVSQEKSHSQDVY